MTTIEVKISENKTGDDITSLGIELDGSYSTYTKNITGLSHSFSEPYPTSVSTADKIQYASAKLVDNVNTIVDDLQTQSGEPDISPTVISYAIL